MGHYAKGILGPFSGKIGTVIGSTWKGKDYMRSLPKPSSHAPTNAQLEQRAKFAIAGSFLKPISSLVNLGFKGSAIGITGFNAAMAEVVKNAVSGVYPAFSIDYSKVLISKGTLIPAWDVKVESPAPRTVVFEWTNNSGKSGSKASDKAILLLYNEEQSQYIFLTDGATRADGEMTVEVPGDFSGDLLETWIAFMSEDEQTVSTSMYAGSVVVS